ncbi:BnaC05g50920D [Brassica napus]|uniref:BnaC05g50920D protein n=1 Tax=Brassica napus TaxID=3708 RepID=A0A078IMU1_BRANA|nr:BnaC05g50920D [Brassica napus]
MAIKSTSADNKTRSSVQIFIPKLRDTPRRRVEHLWFLSKGQNFRAVRCSLH